MRVPFILHRTFYYFPFSLVASNNSGGDAGSFMLLESKWRRIEKLLCRVLAFYMWGFIHTHTQWKVNPAFAASFHKSASLLLISLILWTTKDSWIIVVYVSISTPFFLYFCPFSPTYSLLLHVRPTKITTTNCTLIFFFDTNLGLHIVK